MGDPKRAGKIVSVLTSTLIAIGVIALAASVMMPSTKRARIQFPHPRADDPATTTLSTPTTRP